MKAPIASASHRGLPTLPTRPPPFGYIRYIRYNRYNRYIGTARARTGLGGVY